MAQHAIAMQGEPAWPPDFGAPTYSNPEARKGGQLIQGVLGTFDSLNHLIVKGLAAANIRGYTIESLLARGYVVDDFVLDRPARRGAYLLTRA